MGYSEMGTEVKAAFLRPRLRKNGLMNLRHGIEVSRGRLPTSREKPDRDLASKMLRRKGIRPVPTATKGEDDTQERGFDWYLLISETRR